MTAIPNAAFPVASRESKQVSSYTGSRPDVLVHVGEPATVLDVGCNEGALARDIKRRLPQVCIWGMDINPQAIACADDVLEEGYCLNLDDADELAACLETRRFDTIIAADVLEHTVNPWNALCQLSEHLNPGGQILISLPNFGHWETLLHILLQRFPRRARGLYDDTHLRFFMRGNLGELAVGENCIEVVGRNYRIWERRQTFLDWPLGRFVGWVPWLREYFVFQYIVRVSKAEQ